MMVKIMVSKGINKEVLKDMQSLIEKRINKIISKFEPGITSVKFWLLKDLHHKKGSDKAKGVIYIKNKQVCVSEKSGIDLKEAVSLCLDALEKEIKTIHKTYRQKVHKEPKIRYNGEVCKFLQEEGYGFIRNKHGEEIVFHQAAFNNIDAMAIVVPCNVTYELQETEDGPIAVNIRC